MVIWWQKVVVNTMIHYPSSQAPAPWPSSHRCRWHPQVTLLYGDSDWMDATAGAWLARQVGRDTEVMMVEKAGDLKQLPW